MNNLILLNNFNQYTLLFIFLLFSNLAYPQIKIEIQNTDIDDISAISICLENNEMIKNTIFKTIAKTIIVDAEGYNKIRLSHVGYYDTTLVIKDFTESYAIVLIPKVLELNEIVIKNLKSFTHIDKRKNNNQTLRFALEENTVWYFDINLSDLEVKELYEIHIKLYNICREDKIEISLYETFNDAVNLIPFHKETIDLKMLKNNDLPIFDHKKINVNINKYLLVGLKIIPIGKNRPKEPTFVVTAFQEKETQIYYQKENKTIHKMPNEHYLKYFNAYPLLVKTIKYGK
ncbi:MAG: hypothetical protein EAZ55_13105 [Cytophagales bacterium]|nr:MAG: hypothetical protein EAZ55_13105 [Cytophagales bacterium]